MSELLRFEAAAGRRGARSPNVAWLAAVGLCCAGCVAAAPVVPMRAARYHLDVSLDPPTHGLLGRATIDLVREPHGTLPDGPAAIELWLHPNLEIGAVRVAGAEIRTSAAKRLPSGDGEAEFQPARYRILLRRPADTMTVFVEYHGTLYQDVAAGEKAGEIHNFTMRAHVGDEGVYLADGYWYPQPAHEERDLRLADFTLIADAPAGFELVASGETDVGLRARTRRSAWRSPYALPSMVLVGGRHEVYRDRHNGVELAVHLKTSQAQHAGGLLAAVKRTLDRYEPLVGRYPAREYTIVDNFFSSGFALPCFTLLSSAVIDMGERAANTHGYLDHEMLHSWWGNGIFVDPRDGNWCEALTSYATNYYGHVLDGNEEEARRKRRNYSHYFSRLKPEDDKPLGSFGLPGGCNRQIAYDKGAMVFHMLARRMGQDRFWAAMRRFTDEYMGRYASWEDVRAVCERESGEKLDAFFQEWVRRAGAPRLKLESARYASGEGLVVTIAQPAPAFALDHLPLRYWGSDGGSPFPQPEATVGSIKGRIGFDAEMSIRQPLEMATLPTMCTPEIVELDPDHHVLRKVAAEDIVPTTAATRRGAGLAVVIPHGDLAEAYRQTQSIFESSYDPEKRLVRTAGSIEEGALAERCVLILGDAVRDPYVEGFLRAIDFPVTWDENGFEFESVEYDVSTTGVLCTAYHPGVPGGGVTVVYGNSSAAIPKSSNIPMYEHSLVIFRDGRPVLRRDFEQRRIIPVEHE